MFESDFRHVELVLVFCIALFSNTIALHMAHSPSILRLFAALRGTTRLQLVRIKPLILSFVFGGL